MKRAAKNLTKTLILYSAGIAKTQLNRHPGLKARIADALRTQLYNQAKLNTSYQSRLGEFLPDAVECARLRRSLTTLHYKPLISVVVPTYNTNHDFLRDCLDSVISQVYDNWELCVVDDASSDTEVRNIIKEYAANDSRITYKFLKHNQHIAGATNEAIALAKGEFVALFDHDDMLWPNALLEVVRALNENQELDFIYTDEDKITEHRHVHTGPFFKPDWNPDFLHSVNYITHFSVIRSTLLKQLGGLRKEYNGAQDWDLFLRICRQTNQVRHIPKLVYSWRVHDQSTAKSTDSKPYVVEAQRAALLDDLRAKGYDHATVQQDPRHPGYWRVIYPVQGEPLVSIVIPNKDQYRVVKRCLESIYAKTTYKQYEIILVDTGSTDRRVLGLYRQLAKQHSNFKLVNWPEQPFSYSRSCNEGAMVASGELLVMLNNDTEVITPNWLELMAGEAQRKEIGAVGCLLFFPDGKHIQHAGVGVGLGGVAANSFSMMTLDQPMTQTQHIMLNTKHNMTAVTAACLMMRKQLFEDVGGFAEEFRISYNDVDLCLRLYEKGYQNLYTPYARLLHHESISLGTPAEIKKRDTKEFQAAKQRFIKRWATYITHDPNLNPNLSKDNAFYSI